jgi:hypothetical protein
MTLVTLYFEGSEMNYWNKKTVPHKGWMNQGCEDLEEATHVCDMCGKEEIRYVHTMYHPEATDYFKVGCVCAEKMTNDYKTPKEQLKNMMKRTTWMSQRWSKVDMNDYQEKSFNSKYGRVTVGIFKVDDKYRYHLDNFIYATSFSSIIEAKRFVYDTYKD